MLAFLVRLWAAYAKYVEAQTYIDENGNAYSVNDWQMFA